MDDDVQLGTRHYPGSSEYGLNLCDFWDSTYSMDAQGVVRVTHRDGTFVQKSIGYAAQVTRPPARNTFTKDWETAGESDISGRWTDLDDGSVIDFHVHEINHPSVTIYGEFYGRDGSRSDITIGSYYPSWSGGKLYFWFFTLQSNFYGWADLNLSQDGTKLEGYYQFGHGEPKPWRMARPEQPWENTPRYGRKARPDPGPTSESYDPARGY